MCIIVLDGWNKYYYRKIITNKMHGKYVDQRVYQHFVHTYSRVPYLDREIFNISTDYMRQSRRADRRTNEATQGISFIIKEFKRFHNSQKNWKTHWETPGESGRRTPSILLMRWGISRILVCRGKDSPGVTMRRKGKMTN